MSRGPDHLGVDGERKYEYAMSRIYSVPRSVNAPVRCSCIRAFFGGGGPSGCSRGHRQILKRVAPWLRGKSERKYHGGVVQL